jgi:hypothetical protein
MFKSFIAKRINERRAFALSVTSIMLMFFCVSSLLALSTPLLKTADEALHLDYAWQVSHGKLPNFLDGPEYNTHLAFTPPVQWVWQHPPLYYLLIAPVVGWSSVNTDAQNVVIYGRLATAILGTLSLGALMLFTYLSLRESRYRRVATLVTGIAVSASTVLIGVSGAVYNDTVPFALSALALGYMGHIILRGNLYGKDFFILTILLSLGMLSRSIFAITAASVILFLLTEILSRRKSTGRYIVYTLSMLVAIAGLSGWFYLRNYNLSGSILGRISLEKYVPRVAEGRVHTSFIEQFTSYDFWATTGSIISGSLVLATLLIIALATICYASEVKKVIVLKVIKPETKIASMLAIFGLLQLCSAAYYMSGGGGHHPRYLLALLIPLAYFAARLITHSRTLPKLFSFSIGFVYVLSVYLFIRNMAMLSLPKGDTLFSVSIFDALIFGLTKNHVDSTYLVYLLFFGAIAFAISAITWLHISISKSVKTMRI